MTHMQLLCLIGCATLSNVAGFAVANSISQPAVGPATPPVSVLPMPPDIVAARVAHILARPLFTPGRRPPPVSSTERHVSALPRLSGIVGTPDHFSAIFDTGSQAGASLALEQGGTLEDWVVQNITPHAVTLRRDGKVLVVTPTFAARSNSIMKADERNPQKKVDDRLVPVWQVGQRRSSPLPSYLQRRP